MNSVHSSTATSPSGLPNPEWSAATLRMMAARFGVVPWMFTSGAAEMREGVQAG